MQFPWGEAVKPAVEAAVKGGLEALFSLFRGGRDRRIAFAKDRVAPIEQFVAKTGGHLNQLAGWLAGQGSGAEYDRETQTWAIRTWRTMSHELARLENEAWAAAALVDPKLLRLLEDTRRQVMLLYRTLVLSPIAKRYPEPIAIPPEEQPVRSEVLATIVIPPERPGTPLREILRQVDAAREANARVAQRLRRLLT